MFRHVLEHARTEHAHTRVVTSLAIAVLSIAALAGAAVAVTVDEEDPRVEAAGADIQPADAPTAPQLVRRAALEQAAVRGAARARAAQEAERVAAAADAKADRHAVEPRPAPPAPPAPRAPDHASGNSVWDRLARCESGGNWAASAGLYEGGLQFHPSTWDRSKPAGFPDAAYQASREQQIQVAERVLARQGWGAWPSCASKLGLR